MEFYPLYARLADLPCLVVGGGPVALRKVRELRRSGASVTVNAPEFAPGFAALADTDPRVHLVPERFAAELIAAHGLVIAATSDPAVNAAVASVARAQLRLCNVVDDPEHSSFISPAVVDRDPVIVAVSSGGRAPVLSRLLRQRLERALPSGLAALAEWARGWRAAVREARPDVRARRALWERVFEGSVAPLFLAGWEGAARAEMERLLAAPADRGVAWLVGAGPGDPDLVTVAGLERIARADAILYDRLVAPELLRHARREAELVDVGKRAGGPATDQAWINAELVRRVGAGQRVCRLKGGDPFVFGRGGEELLALRAAGLDVEVIPGVTAAAGCAAAAGIPLTHRGVATSVTLHTARGAAGAPVELPPARRGETLVVYMGAQRLHAVSEALLRGGRGAGVPAAVIAAGTTTAQRVVRGTLGNIAVRAAAAPMPALLIVGDAAGLVPAAETPGETAPAPGSRPALAGVR